MPSTHLALPHAFLLLLLLLSPSLASAQAPVLVLPHGGVRALPAYTLERQPSDDTWRVTRQADRVILADDQPLERFTDVKTLPDQSLLLSGLLQAPRSGVAIATLSPRAAEVILEADNDFTRIDSASVATASAPGTPSRLLVADSNTSFVSIWDLEQRAFIWRQPLSISGTRATLSQAIAMPRNRVVTAAHWPALDLWALDVFHLTPEDGTPARYKIASRDLNTLGSDDLVEPSLANLRDVMALDADTLVLTTTTTILAIDIESAEVLWTIRAADLDALRGELASARLTPDGHLVAATFEPGKWVEPHPNHRLHWFALSQSSRTTAPSLIATSPSLDRAPQRVTSRESDGGTGTLFYEGAIDPGQSGSDLSVITPTGQPSLDFVNLKQGARTTATVTFSNPSSQTLTPPSLAIAGAAGDNCQLGTLFATNLVTAPPGARLDPLGVYTLTGDLEIPLDASPGSWCIFPAIKLEDGTWRHFTRFATKITVVSEDGSGGADLPRQELPVESFEPGTSMPPDQGMGEDDMGMGPTVTFPEDEGSGGCGSCTTTSRNTSPNPLFLLIVFGALGRLARQRRSRCKA